MYTICMALSSIKYIVYNGYKIESPIHHSQPKSNHPRHVAGNWEKGVLAKVDGKTIFIPNKQWADIKRGATEVVHETFCSQSDEELLAELGIVL